MTYLGTKGRRSQQQFLPNTWPAGAANLCPACPSGFIYLASNGNSIRHSAQLQLRRRLRAGFTAQLAYAFAKSLDNVALGGQGGAAVIAQDWLDLDSERALSNFDQRHLANLTAQYTTGMGIAGGTLLGGWTGALFKDWTIAGQLNAGSGLPLTPVWFAPVKNTGVTGSLRPDFTGASLYAAPPGRHLNPAAVAAPSAGYWGNAGRNSMTGPAQFSLNASLARTFRLGDRINADLRIEAINPLNHVVFSKWNAVATGYTLLPGSYSIKVLARDNETGRIGTYLSKFTIPNLNKETQRIPISSVVLSSQRIDLKEALYTVGKDKAQIANPLVQDGQKMIPSVTRVFSRARDMYIYFQAYDQSTDPPRPLAAWVTFYRGNAKAFETPPIVVTERLNNRLRTMPVKFNIVTDKLMPGRYVAQVTILDPQAGKMAFWQAPILVVP